MLNNNVKHKYQGTHVGARTATQATPVTQCVRGLSITFRRVCLGLHVVVSLDIRLLNGIIRLND